MTIEEANFIVKHYNTVLDLQTKVNLHNRRAALKIEDLPPCEIRKQIWEQDNWITNDPEILNYLDQDYVQYILTTAADIVKKHPDEVVLNRCPECRAFTRTPFSRQCRVCRHKWHDKS